MGEPAEEDEQEPSPKRVDDSEFWRPRSREEMKKGKRPLRSLDEFAIEDLTDKEWETFAAAINE